MANALNRHTQGKTRIYAAVFALSLLFLPACGQIGPLYLPDTDTVSPIDSSTTDSSISQDDDSAPQPKR